LTNNEAAINQAYDEIVAHLRTMRDRYLQEAAFILEKELRYDY